MAILYMTTTNTCETRRDNSRPDEDPAKTRQDRL